MEGSMTPATSTYSILVVDDDPDIVLGLQDFLDHHGYQVQVAYTCAEAVAAARNRHYDAVILDLSLPDGDGFSVLRTLQDLDPKMPVIILTAFTATEKTVGSLSEGAFAYLTKPYNREELRAILTRAVGVHELATKVQYAEHALSESEERFRSLVESATDAIVLADEWGIIITWNNAARTLFGYTQDEMRGRPLTAIMPERYRAAHEQGFQQFRSTGVPRLIGSLIVVDGLRKDGTEFPLELSLATWKAAGRSFFSGIIRDITERRRAEEALDRLRRQHALILTQAGEGIYGLDMDGNTTFVNTAASTLLGYDAEELLGRSMHELLHHTNPDGTPYPREACPIYAAIHDGRVHRATDELFWKKNGDSFPVEYVSTPIREDRRVVGAVVVFRDISDRKRAEAALDASEKRFRSLVANIPGVVYRCACDAEWTMRFLSEAIQELCGYPASDFVDNLVRPFASIIHPDDRQMVQETIRKAVLLKQPYQLEYRIVTADGNIRWAYETGQGIFDTDGDGRLLWLDGVIIDITPRKSAETSLQQSETRYRALFNDNPSMYYMVGGDGTVLSVNRFGCQRLGYSEQDLIGGSVFKVFHESDRETVRRNLDACLGSPGVPMTWELRKVRKDESVIWVRETAQGTVNERGEPVVLIVSEDITAVKETERALRESEDFTKQILRSSADCIKVLDLHNRVVFINDAGTSLLELPEQSAVLGKEWTEFWEGEDRAAAASALAAAKAGEVGKFVGCCPTLTGRPTWWDVQVTPMYDAHGVLHRLLVISRDITEYRRVQDALHVSEERLAHVIRGSNDGFWDVRILPDEPWYSPRTPVWWSPRVRDMLGVNEAEFPEILESWLSRMHPDDKDSVFTALKAHIEDRVPYDKEYRLSTKEGEYQWFRARGQGEWDADGRLIRMAGSLQCIEDRKRAEEALCRNEELLRSVINNSTAVIYAKDTEGRYLLVNTRFERLFSISLEQVRGKTDHEIFPKEFADAFRANDVLVQTTGRVFESEEFAPHPDGLHTYISIKFPLFDHQGRVYASCGISTDITERKRHEEQLRASEERLRMALSASHVGIWDWDIRSGRMYWSAGVEALCGLATSSFGGTYAAYMELVYLEDRGALLTLIQRALESHAAIDATHRVVWPDGTLHWLAWNGRIHRDAENRPVRVLGTVSDVTGRRLHHH
jgi:PAS domain S-box-containing protein